MPYFGCHLSSAGGYRSMVNAALSIGGNTFQFFTRNPRGSRSKVPDPDDIAAASGTMAEQHFGPLVAHGAYTMNLCTKEAEARRFAAGVLADDLHRVSMLPGCLYNFHPGSHVGQGVSAGVSQIVSALASALEQEPSITVLLETMSGKGSEIGGRFEELRMIIDAAATSQLGVCLDTCHVWDAGYDIRDNLECVLDEFDSVIGISRLKALHINDSKNPLGSHKDRHARLGDGLIGLDAIAAIVSHPALRQLPMILETPNDLDGYQKELKVLQSFIKT